MLLVDIEHLAGSHCIHLARQWMFLFLGKKLKE